MVNFIVKETYDLWKENIGYLIYHGASEGKDSDDIAESILDYLIGEGAFEILEDKHPLPAEELIKDVPKNSLLESLGEWDKAVEKRGYVN